jgi:PAS domain S-box-containing protein
VPGTEWILVARIDTGELFEPLAKTLWLTVILVGALLLLAGVALGLIWRHQRARHYKERVRAAEALRDSERNYRIMFDNAPEGLWMIGPDRRTTEVNRRMCELLGYERDEMLGRDPTDFADVENGRIFKANALVVPGRPTYHFEIALRHRDGHNIPTEVYAANLYDQDGSVRAGLAFVVDLSSRVRFEMELVRLNEELAQREEERKQALSVANRELESFSYSVSHDLGAPLRAISGYSRIIDENHAGSLDEQGRVLLRRVGAAAERMGALIADLLMLSRISRQELNRGPVDLSALARQAAEELQAAEPARMARSSWSIADGVQVVGDAGLLRVALQNLLGNAWKYSSKRDAAHIEFGVTGNGGREAYFVRDNGVGFDMAYAHKLFVAFQRLHGPAEFPGTGIGLATVARVVQRHGGEVWAEGKENEGATFYFTL